MAAKPSLQAVPVSLTIDGEEKVAEVEPRDLFAMSQATRGMGQELFQPPNVKGWSGGRRWRAPSTVCSTARDRCWPMSESIPRPMSGRWSRRARPMT